MFRALPAQDSAYYGGFRVYRAILRCRVSSFSQKNPYPPQTLHTNVGVGIIVNSQIPEEGLTVLSPKPRSP